MRESTSFRTEILTTYASFTLSHGEDPGGEEVNGLLTARGNAVMFASVTSDHFADVAVELFESNSNEKAHPPAEVLEGDCDHGLAEIQVDIAANGPPILRFGLQAYGFVEGTPKIDLPADCARVSVEAWVWRRPAEEWFPLDYGSRGIERWYIALRPQS